MTARRVRFARSPSGSAGSRDEHLLADRCEDVHGHAVRAQPLGNLELVRDRRRDEDLDRTGLSGAPAVSAFEGRAPEQDATEDAKLALDVEVVLPGTELAAGMDAALAAPERRFVSEALARGKDGLGEGPRVAVEDAPQTRLLVDAQQLRELLRGEDLELIDRPRPRATDAKLPFRPAEPAERGRIFGVDVLRDEPRDELALGRAESVCGAVQLVRLGGRNAHEDRCLVCLSAGSGHC